MLFSCATLYFMFVKQIKIHLKLNFTKASNFNNYCTINNSYNSIIYVQLIGIL